MPEERDVMPIVERREDGVPILKVASSTIPKKLAGSISSALEKNPRCDVIAIGAGAVNQTIKAIAIARGITVPKGYDITNRPFFTKVDMAEGTTPTADAERDGRPEEKTGIQFIIERTSR